MPYAHMAHSGALGFSEYDTAEPITVPPRRLVVDVPGWTWEDTMAA